MDSLYTINEVAKILRLSKPSVYRLMSSKKLTSVKIGGRTLFKESEINRFIDGLGGEEDRT
ncbi:MAG TPA: helix-turn-helix domain-containing protein [Syntrophorhabdaceae bacterium]|nr:helix-turn-helix domain-containing protein [Syntrophorhabdaceae bacterium]